MGEKSLRENALTSRTSQKILNAFGATSLGHLPFFSSASRRWGYIRVSASTYYT
jgi:hypothetical protein